MIDRNLYVGRIWVNAESGDKVHILDINKLRDTVMLEDDKTGETFSITVDELKSNYSPGSVR